MKTIRGPFKYHGGKFFLAKWIISHFPENYQHMTYIEPFCGGASVFLNKLESKEEIINDIDKNLIYVFRILRDQCTQFINKIKKVKYDESTFEEALKREEDCELDKALNEFVIRRMSRGGLGKAFSWSKRERGGQPGEVNAWETIIETLPELNKRLKNTIILNKSAMLLLKIFNDENICVYIDPPYLPETRESPSVYENEMTIEQHVELADLLNNFKGKALISGYPSKLYGKLYKNWRCEVKKIANHASQQKTKPIKMELLWCNF